MALSLSEFYLEIRLNHGARCRRFSLARIRRSSRLNKKSAAAGQCCSSVVPLAAASTGFEKKPGAAFSFIDPILDQACGGDVAKLVNHIMNLT
jgi:hypothetical protein